MLEIKTKIIFDPPEITNKHLKQKDWKNVVICQVNDDTDIYYANFLFKRFGLVLNRSIRKTHITIINDRISEMDVNLYAKAKEAFNGKELTFKFDPSEIRSNGKHWWLKVYSDEADVLRNVVGLDNPYYPYHLTLGYANERNIENSKNILKAIMFHGL
jgi:hypothetical protein